MTDTSKQWVTVGSVSDFPDPAAARGRARDILIVARDGISLASTEGGTENDVRSPATCISPARSNHTFETLLPLYLEYCEKNKRIRNLFSTVIDKKRRLTKHVQPHWGKTDIGTLTRKDVMRLFNGLDHVPGSAYQVYSMLNDFFKWAVLEESIAVSPMAGMGSPYKVGERDRCLNDDEIRWFWRACDELGWPVGAWGKMLLLTAQRCGEVANMSRSAIDRHYVWTLPAGMTKSRRMHIVFLSDFAKEVFRSIPEIDKTGRVFGSSKMNTRENKERIDALMLRFCGEELVAAGRKDFRFASIEHWVFHDLRRTGATVMAKKGHPKDIVHKVLNHSDGGGRGRGQAMLDRVYIIHEYLEERETALQALGNHIKKVVTESPRI